MRVLASPSLRVALGALVLAMWLPGCPSDPGPADEVDSGRVDGGGAVDSGTRDDASPGDSGPLADTGPSVDSGSPASDSGVLAGPCPAERPEARTPCATDGLVCEYGPRTCLSQAECAGGSWEVAVPRCPPEPDTCPATREAAHGNACDPLGARCLYDDGLICTCTDCPNPYPICMIVDPPVWACEPPNAEPGCPIAQPLLGTGCATEGQTCDYGCESGERRVCVGGGWTRSSAPGGCPRSTRRAKRDIEYLDEGQVDAIASEVARTRLTTYEYTDPALAGRRHLGFIIEDQPLAYSVDPERSQVDLYGYTSMLVAAYQTQQRRLDALEAEVRELRAERQARRERTPREERREPRRAEPRGRR